MSQEMFQAYLLALFLVLLLATGVWLVSLIKRNVAIVDIFWSLFIWLCALLAYLQGSQTPIQTLLFVLASIWAFRLGFYLVLRNWQAHEDRRYVQIRQNYSPYFGLKSLPIIFIFQGVLAWLISSEFFAANDSQQSLYLLSLLGAVIAIAGIIIESLADWQMWRFNQLITKPKPYLDTGLWQYCRHPNYFGEFLVWWGFFLMAAPAGYWWSILPPLLISWMLMRFSGVTLAEQDIDERRPGYGDYKRSTPAFFPAFNKVFTGISNHSES